MNDDLTDRQPPTWGEREETMTSKHTPEHIEELESGLRRFLRGQLKTAATWEVREKTREILAAIKEGKELIALTPMVKDLQAVIAEAQRRIA